MARQTRHLESLDIISMSPFSTPVAGHPSNQFNQASTTLDNHGKEADDELHQWSGTDRFWESAEVHVQEAREDEEARYARLEDICSEESGQASTQRRYIFTHPTLLPSVVWQILN